MVMSAPPIGVTASTVIAPSVTVPVLSRITVSILSAARALRGL
jgi:hypothetical protein